MIIWNKLYSKYNSNNAISITQNYMRRLRKWSSNRNRYIGYTVSACCRVTRFSRLNIAHFLFFHVLLVGYTLTYRRGCSCLRKYEGCAVIDSLQSQWVSERVVPTHSIPRRVRLLCATHAACYYNYSNESRLQLFRANIAHTHFITKYLKTKVYNYTLVIPFCLPKYI